MLGHNSREIPEALFENWGFRPCSSEAGEAFEAALIALYEGALDAGVRPAEALALLLSFAAKEAGRIEG